MDGKCCDNCIHYHWYYDKCDKWDCEVDARECHSCFEERKEEKKDLTERNNAKRIVTKRIFELSNEEKDEFIKAEALIVIGLIIAIISVIYR